MNIVVDTSVWSLVLRRRRVNAEDPWIRAFIAHVKRGDAIHLPGPVVQELFDGLTSPGDFERLVLVLGPFPLVPAWRTTYVEAARIRNTCRRHGIQAGQLNSLMAATCIERDYPLLTADADFRQMANYCKLILLPPWDE